MSATGRFVQGEGDDLPREGEVTEYDMGPRSTRRNPTRIYVLRVSVSPWLSLNAYFKRTIE